MNHEWTEVSFGEIFEITSSKRVLEAQWKSAGVPFYRAREIVKLAREGTVQNELFISEELYNEYQVRYGVPKEGDLMISAVGTLGACYAVKPSDRFYYKDASVLRFSPKRPLCSRFIQHAFLTTQVLDQVHAGSSSTVGTYTISRANETRLLLPPLAEQERIAEVLDWAEVLRAKRRVALALLDDLSQSLFIEMFGDPGSAKQEFRVQKLGEVALRITDGEHQTPKRTTEGIKLLSARNIRDGFIDTEDVDYVGQDEYERIRRRCDPQVGDILISCSGTIGRVAIVKLNEPLSLVRSVALVKPDRGIHEPEFLEHYLRTPAMKTRMIKSAHSSSQANLFQGPIRELEILIPPLPLQQEFARRIRAVEKLKASHRDSLAELDALFAALQHRAFRGEL